MEFRDLKTLIAIAESGSLAAAARKIHLTQPALSASLKRLEEELGVILVRRHSRGAIITEEGRLVLQKAYGVLHDMGEIESVARNLADTPVGDVRIGFPTTIAGGVVAELVEQAKTRLPHVHLHIVEAMSGGLAEMLQLGRLDLAMMFDIQPMAGLQSEPILIEEPKLLVSETHALAARKLVTLSDVGNIPFVLPSPNHSIRAMVDRFAKAEGLTLNVVADVDSFVGLLQLATKGYATILPTYLAQDYIRAGTLVPRSFVQPHLEWTVHLATRQDATRPRATIATARLVVDICTDLVLKNHWPGKLHPRHRL